MTERNSPIGNEDIHAYVDGQLPPERHAYIEERSRTDARLREMIEQYREQNQLFHQAYDDVLNEPVPAQLRGFAHRSGSASARRPIWWNIAASILLMTGGGAIGWTVHGTQIAQRSLVDDLVQPAAVAHAVYSPEVRHPVEVDASQEQHLVKWLSKRLGAEVRAPKLSSAGFNLVGGRLLPGNGGPAAQFMYEDERGERLTLYVRSKADARENLAFRFFQHNDVNVFYWIDGKFGYVLAGGVTRTRLLDAANRVYRELTL